VKFFGFIKKHHSEFTSIRNGLRKLGLNIIADTSTVRLDILIVSDGLMPNDSHQAACSQNSPPREIKRVDRQPAGKAIVG
jgi:hypothetical protein